MSHRLRVDDRFTIEMAPPTAGRVEELAREGYRSVVNLRAPGEQGEILSPSEEGEIARRHGLEYVSIPVSPQDMNEAMAERFEREVSRLPGPVAIHCASGKRAGLFTFLHVARTEGLSGEEAVAKAEAMGFQFANPDTKAFFTRAADAGRTARGGSS
ncbi:phosphatase (plasmid) [Azospirillum sp. TSA2s]|uniref:beta-lactamase hydrolase domain-containing protein n=1 Tax=Azospirillum sp. TSA2s TaxID=709810 RepID=UPI0010AA78E5|nr:sulfur transferase domain-containing protein [Azospirillum sp. TSA2s]QCG99116.1 phosphatase [Azospirillum sp. TSA2s]